MSKIICDICGTKYPDTADQCPICGCARVDGIDSLADELIEEEAPAAPARRAKGGRFSASNSRKRKLPRYEEEPEEEDEDDEDEYDEDDDLYESDYDDDDDDDDEDDDRKSNAPLVVLLIIVIFALLAVTGFILVKFFLPNMMGKDDTVPTDPIVTTAAPVETEAPTVPCENLVMTSGGSVELNEAGQNWLINVMALPDNTTDKVIYTSSDETVATVNADGKITAVGEGEAIITISCGEESLICTVTCNFGAGETEAPTEATEAPTEATEAPTEPTEAPTEPTEPLKDITLKVLKYTDLTFNGPGQGFTFVLDGLKNTEVKWISQDESIVTVDENGTVISVGTGNTTIICQYGEQKVEIKITCRW